MWIDFRTWGNSPLVTKGTEKFWERSKVFGTEWQMFFFSCWLLIPEQILWLDMPLIRLNVFFYILYRFHGLMRYTSKIHESPVLSNTYVCTGYFIGFTFLENVVLLVSVSHFSCDFIKVSIIGIIWFLLKKIEVLKIQLSVTLWMTSIFRGVAGHKNFFKGFPVF